MIAEVKHAPPTSADLLRRIPRRTRRVVGPPQPIGFCTEPGTRSFSGAAEIDLITTVATDTIDILTYPYAAYLYTATNTTYNIPYQWLHWAEYENSHPQPALKTYTRLTLENDWLKVSFLPSWAGASIRSTTSPPGMPCLQQLGHQAHQLGDAGTRLVAGGRRHRVGPAGGRTWLRMEYPVVV